jgi:sugar O-acyltransferase (sialic acid O-acetyltransferase NeuD family)
MSDVVIFGTGQYARVARRYLDADSPHDVIAFTVHRAYADGDELDGLPLIPFEELPDRHPPGSAQMLVATGFSNVNRVRAGLYAETKALGYSFVSYVSSQAMVWEDVPIGENSFVFEGVVIQPGCSVGSDVVVWSAATIAHDVAIDDHCFLAPRVAVSGDVAIGHHSFLGINATVRNGVTVAPYSVIGAGTVIMRDTEEGCVYSVPGTEPQNRKSWELQNL